LKAWQTFRLSASFCSVFPFAQIHFHAFLQMRLSSELKFIRYGKIKVRPPAKRSEALPCEQSSSSGLHPKLKLCPAVQLCPMWKLQSASKARASRLPNLLACGLNSTSELNQES
jgi:hypothetical protein